MNISFNVSMQARINEVTSDKHMKMSYIEFLEALARVADILSYPPPTESFKNKYKNIKETNKDNAPNAPTKKSSAVDLNDSDAEEEGETIDMPEEELLSQPLNK